ncbi:MAG: enoyl-CoA hydratase/isomerase family protein [Microthrixaceae bacterium]
MSIASYSRDGRIGRITISRPERRNALNHEALDQLHEGVRSAREDGVRVLVLTGDADHFCSGADLKELEDLEFTRALRLMLDDLAALAVPTVAAISGACMGLGMQLALACDLRIATDDARFAVPVAKLGLMVDHWTLQRLALLAGHSTARWMAVTARPVTAARAHQVGLVQELVPGGDDGPGASVLAAADELAGEIAALAPMTLAGTKAGLDLLERDAAQLDPEGRYLGAFHAAWASDDLVEGRRAFAERRPAEFEGR